jgi:hypothetical protein
MKFIFTISQTSKTIGKKRSLPFQSKSGYGRAIIGGLLGSEKGKARCLQSKAIQIVVKKSAALTEEVIKQKNEQELQKIVAYEQEAEMLSRIMHGKPSMKKMMLILLKEIRKGRDEFKILIARMSEGNKSLIIPSQYKESELATIYVDYVVDKGIAEPSQIQLKEHSKISQSTWSRAFQSLTFWKEVNLKIENVWNAKEIVTRNIDSVLKQKVDNKEIKESDSVQGRLKIADLAKIDERDTIFLKIDCDRFKTWDKSKLMKAIIKLRHEAKLAELEKCTEEELRKILVMLS